MDFWRTFKGAHLIFNMTTYQECYFIDCTKMHIPSPFWRDFQGLDCLKLNQLLYIFQYTW